MKSTKNNIHAGHRERFRKQIQETGICNVSDLHFLEHILMFSIPRADTNPIAHRLLEEFGTIDAIFEASEDALLSVEGIGPKSVALLQSMLGACSLYNKAKALKRPFVGNLRSAVSFILNILPPSTNEQFIVLIVGKNYKVKHYKIFKGLSHSLISFDAKELTEYLVKHKASFCIFAHTHPEHSATPSSADQETFNKLILFIDAIGTVIFDNIIIGENDVYTFKNQTYRTFDELFSSDFLSNHTYEKNGMSSKTTSITKKIVAS